MDGGVLAGRLPRTEKASALSLGVAAMEETSAVDVSGQHDVRDGEQSPERTEWDLVKGDVKASPCET